MAGNLTYKVAETLQKYLNKRKWIVGIAAVVLFSLSFTDWSMGMAERKDLSSSAALLEGILYKKSVKDEEIVEKGPANVASQFGSGGPVLSQNGGFLANGAGPVDLSADDEEENQSFYLLNKNSLFAPMAPDEDCYFDSFKKEIKTYTVRSGDTAETIAAAHGINTHTLLWANDLKETSIIRPGQELTILPINGVRIQTKSGDTIGGLAKKYSADPGEIIAYNTLPADGSFKAGQHLILPGGEMPTPVVTYSYSAPKYVAEPISSGWLIMPTTGYNWGRLHSYNAVDIANKCGTPIYAAAAGSVSLSDSVGWNGGYGKYVKISHSNGVVTLYSHFSSIIVDAGDSVKQGQLIGYMGTTGRSTGCHVHFEVRGATNPFVKR